MELNTITSESAQAIVTPAGGKLTSLKLKGVEILVDSGPKVTRWGSFPMIPWCGRLNQGALSFEGQDYSFEQTAHPHANHGFCHTKPWRVTSTSDSQVAMETELDGEWPFGGKVEQTFSLDANSLVVSAKVTAGDATMPVMIGWHPWFVRELTNGAKSDLVVEPAKMYELQPDLIPTGEIVDVKPQPWDNCFLELASDPIIRWGENIELTISSDLDHWVIYTEPEHAFCVEPQSGPPHQSNTDPRVLQPGESFAGWMKFSW